MRRILITLPLLLILVFTDVIVFAQHSKFGIPELEYFNRRQYGAATQNWKVSQSESDIMYFANNDGLLEFDGVGWRLHRDMGELIVRSVKCLDDQVYVGGDNEFGYFYHDSLHHLHYQSLATTEEKKAFGNFWSILEWGTKIVFQADNAICIVENGDVVQVIKAKSRFKSSFVVNGLLLVQDEAVGLMEVRGSKVFPVVGGNVFSAKTVSSIMALSSDKIVIGTMKHGMYLWDMQSIKVWNVPANDDLKKANIFCGTSYGNEYLIFGTIQSGFLITDQSGRLVMQVGKDKGLVNNTVLSVFVDREGGIWGGLDNGIARLSLNSSVSLLSGYYNLGTGYVMKRHEDDYYFGTNQALFTIGSTEFSNPLKDRDDFTKVEGTEGQVWSIYTDETEILCGHNLGVFSVDGHSSELITPPSVNGVWKFIRIDDQPSLMLAGTYNGFILLKKKDGRWMFDRHVSGFDESSRFVEKDKNGDYWVAHGSIGLFKLRFSKNYETVEAATSYGFSLLPDQSPISLTIVQGDVVVNGRHGVFKVLNDGIESFKRFDTFFEPGQYPTQFKEDQYRNIWFFQDSKVGVLRFLEDGSFKKIDYPFLPLERKLVSGFESVYVANERNVFFGVEDGFAHYAVQDNQNFKMPFKVHLRSFKGVSDSVGYVLHQLGTEVEQLVVPEYAYKNNSFEVNFAASFYQDDDVLYSTQLSGVEEKASSWSTLAYKQFAQLKEGDYTFTIHAKNRYGVEAQPLSFRFTILPPWHRHLYAKLLYVVFILLLSIIVFFIFNRRIEISRQKEKLKQKQRFRAKEEQLINEALRSEKEVIKMRNDRLRSEMLFKEKELANSTMSIIQKNEFLNSVKENLKRLKNIKDQAESSKKISQLIKKIDKDIDNESNWDVFELHLEQVHADFLKRLQNDHPEISSREKKLCAYIRMGMTSKEIAVLMNISFRAVENNRYRLRQKLNISQGENLSRYIAQI